MVSRQPIRIKFIGDVSFNNNYIPLLESGGKPFEAMRSVLNDADLVVGNLECLAEGSAQNEAKIPRIHTSVDALDALKDLNLGLVSLATNHVYDNLEEGFWNATNKLDELGIEYLGASLDAAESSKSFIFEKNHWKIGFLNYLHEDTNPTMPAGAKVYPNMYDLSNILEEIRSLKAQVDKVVLVLHWGGKCDYGYLPHQEQIEHAKQMIDAGASAIIGHHTHTFQASMIYNNAPIHFSLGNFCFDDIVMGKSTFRVRGSGRKSGIVEVVFTEDGVGNSVLPFRINGLNVELDSTLNNEFKKWNRRFWLARNIPGVYSMYYYLLKRWEPVHFHAESNDTSMAGVALSKVKRIFALG